MNFDLNGARKQPGKDLEEKSPRQREIQIQFPLREIADLLRTTDRMACDGR